MNKQIELFLKLVKIYSPVGNEKPIIDFLVQWLKKRKIKFNIDKRGNIFFGFYKNTKPILFSAHVDTVKSPLGKINPIVNRRFIKAGKNMILGADNKASLSALLTLVDWYLEKKPEKSMEILLTAGEEDGSDLVNFQFSKIKSKLGFVFDSIAPIGTIILASPYITNFEINFFGKVSHSSKPELGANAFLKGINFLKKFPPKIYKKDDLIFNLGLIKGGQGINIIPDRLTIKGEIRSLKKDKFFEKIDYLKKYFINTKDKLIFSGFCPGYYHKKNDIEIKKIRKIFKKLNIKSKFENSFAVSDANELNDKRIKVINLGDGVYNAHTDKEKINIKDLKNIFAVSKEIILHCIENKL